MNLKNLLSYSTIRLALVAVASCLLIQSANAALLFSEPFGQTPGALGGAVNAGNSTAWNGGNAGLNIVSGNLTYAGLADQGGNELDVSNQTAGTSINTFANQTSGQVYYSFLLDVTTADGANDYITSLNPGSSTPNGGSDALAVYVYSNNTLGIRSTPASTVHTAGPVTLNTTYLVVVDYDFTAQAVNLWLDPTPGGSQPAATETLTGATGTTAIDNVGFKAQATTGNFLVDNLLIGTTWADVTPAAVPEPSTVALAAAGLGLMLAMARRRR